MPVCTIKPTQVKDPTSRDDEPDVVFETKAADTSPIDERKFPDAFYCPITKKIMEDPVVIPDGNSYERSAIMEQERNNIDFSSKLYLNRALLTVISETVDLSTDSSKTGVNRLNKTIKVGVKQQLTSKKEFLPLPDVYHCPITLGLIHDPVIDPEGNTFEKVAIEAWIQKNGSSPITRTSFSKEDLYCNHAITALLGEEKGKSAESMHPSVRKFKEEAPPQVPVASSNETEAREYLSSIIERIGERRRILEGMLERMEERRRNMEVRMKRMIENRLILELGMQASIMEMEEMMRTIEDKMAEKARILEGMLEELEKSLTEMREIRRRQARHRRDRIFFWGSFMIILCWRIVVG